MSGGARSPLNAAARRPITPLPSTSAREHQPRRHPRPTPYHPRHHQQRCRTPSRASSSSAARAAPARTRSSPSCGACALTSTSSSRRRAGARGGGQDSGCTSALWGRGRRLGGQSAGQRRSPAARLSTHSAPLSPKQPQRTRLPASAPRPGEQHGRDYFFVSRAEFEAWIQEGRLLEHAVVYGEYKGVPLDQIEAALARGTDVVLRLDVQGAAAVRRLLPARRLTTVFVAAESEAALAARLVGRATEPVEQLVTRVATAREVRFFLPFWRRRLSDQPAPPLQTPPPHPASVIIPITPHHHHSFTPRAGGRAHARV